MSRVGISTACYYPKDTFESFCEVLKADVPVAEVFMNSLTEITPENLSRYKSEMQAHGTEIVSFHPYMSAFESLLFFSEYTLRISDGIEFYKRFFEAAKVLGAKYFVFHGEKNVPTFSRGLSEDSVICEVYGRLIETAKSFDLVFTQENVNNHRSQSAEHIRKLSELVPELCFTFDLKQAFRAKQNYADIISAMGKNLRHVHINDFGEHECCLPFEGFADLPDVKKRLIDVGFCGDYILEVYRTCFNDLSHLCWSLEKTKQLFACN